MLRWMALVVLLGGCGPWGAVADDIYSDQCKVGAERCDQGVPQVCRRGGTGKSPSPFAEWKNKDDLCNSNQICKVKGDAAVCVKR